MTKNPSFCFITPISYLGFTQISRAHLVDESAEYAEFYARQSELGDFIMMDNSAYELKVPYSPEKLIELGKKCNAHAIVLPDYPFQPGQVTIDAAQQFIPQFLDAGVKTFFVPQSKSGDLEDWIDTYTWAANNPDIDIIGMSILGIPNALTWCDPSYARVVMTQMLIDRGVFNFNKHHHYLGLNAGPALEIPSLIRLNALDTIDSSGPVWSGILGHEYTKNADSYQMVKKIKLPVDFHIAATKDAATVDRIFTNVRLTQELMAGGANAVWYANE
jgi:hypothetical protein